MGSIMLAGKVKIALDIIYTLSALGGAAVIAMNINENFLGYMLFMVASISGWMIVAPSNVSKSVLVVMAVYFIINCIGMYRYYENPDVVNPVVTANGVCDAPK